MATELQIAAVDKLGSNIKKFGKVSVSRAMRETITTSGKRYALSTTKTPKVLTGSKGFKEIYMKKGLTAGLITGALVDDIKKKPQNRVPELRLGSEILKMTDRESNGDKTLIINISGETAIRYGILNDRIISPQNPKDSSS